MGASCRGVHVALIGLFSSTGLAAVQHFMPSVVRQRPYKRDSDLVFAIQI